MAAPPDGALMFGTWRWLLAHMVMLAHLWREPALWAGTYAVFGFFALSGYLMALVLHRTYGFSGPGVRRYLANRALRIYPPYLATVAVAALLVALVSPAARSHTTLHLPSGPLEWLQNLVILGSHWDRPRATALVPPIWSVDIELWFYLAMPLLARSRRRVLAWFGASLAWTAWLLWSDAAFPARYSNVPAASLPYSAGALLYLCREPLGRALGWWGHRPLSLGLFLANTWSPFAAAFGSGFYLSLGLALYTIAAWAPLRPSRVPRPLARADALLGDLSYPVFLCHWAAALAVLALGWADGQGALLFAAALPVTNALAFAIHRGVEAQVARLRDRVRPGGAAAAGPQRKGAAATRQPPQDQANT